MIINVTQFNFTKIIIFFPDNQKYLCTKGNKVAGNSYEEMKGTERKTKQRTRVRECFIIIMER